MISGSAALHDFSDKLSPVFVRDLRQGLRAHHFVWAFILLQGLSFASTLVEVILLELIGESVQGGFLSGFFFAVLVGTFCFALPLTLFGTLQDELGQGRNIELLLTSSLTRWQLVRGKLLVSCCLSGLLLASLLPYFLIRYFLGSLDLLNATAQIGVIVGINICANAVVIGASGFRNYVGRCATILYFILFFSISAVVMTLPVFASLSTGYSSFQSTILPTLLYCALATLFAGYGLQLGRANIRLFENPVDPPSASVIFILVFSTPIIVGIASAAGGAYAGLAVLALLIWAVLLIDKGSSGKNRLKGLQP